jgi:GNAT superfamily N-acetyltransferase
MKEYKFTKLNRDQFNTLIKWAEQEGWNPGPYDADVFWQTDPDGYWGYLDDGEVIAGGSIVSYNSEFGFMGFFIVKPELRSKGMGRKLWYLRRDTLLSRLNDGASIGMDGVVDMQHFYRKGGFEIAFRDVRMEAVGKSFNLKTSVKHITDDDVNTIIEYDKMCFGFDRSKFMKAWLNMKEAKSFQFIDDKELKGFAVLRKAGVGYKIGPLFADNYSAAEELLKACFNAAGDEQIYLDIPMVNKEAIKLAEQFEMKPVFECARMYYGNPPEVPIKKIYGITTFELG